MVQIVVIAHAEIANSFADCIEHILSKRVENLHILPIKKSEDIEIMLTKVRQFIDKLSLENEVLILTDIFGATPSNLAAKLVKKNRVELISGLNLSMLIRAVSYAKNSSLDICVEKVIAGGKEAIILVNESR